MSTHINLIVHTTPAGVAVQVYGPLHAENDAAKVARMMVEFAEPLFMGGKPIVLMGEAEPQIAPAMSRARAALACNCDTRRGDLSLHECQTLRCAMCGGELLA